jgi:hypothetical protein
MLADLCSRSKALFAPGEKIYERRTLCIVINAGQVGVNGKVLTLNDSWGHDFILENPLLRHDQVGLVLSFAEVEFVTFDHLERTISVHNVERKIVEKTKILLALSRGIVRVVDLIRSVDIPQAPIDVRREGLRVLDEVHSITCDPKLLQLRE